MYTSLRLIQQFFFIKLYSTLNCFDSFQSLIYRSPEYIICNAIKSFPPIKHQKINLIQGSDVEPVIKSSVTNFNHYISRAWD